MLTDYRTQQDHSEREHKDRWKIPRAFGRFIAELADWDWFINPFSFRDRIPGFGPPVPGIALSRLNEYLMRLQIAAGQPIGWVIAEEFGRLGGRYHGHALITGVRHLSLDFWRREAYRCFGRTKIELFDPSRGAAFYVTKHAGTLTGKFDLGGFLKGRDLSKCEQSHSPGGGRDVVKSQPFLRSFFHTCLPHRHR